jgi:SanA protein
LKYIFDQNEFTIISQKFHNQRAIYIANSLQLNAIGYNAQEVDAYNGFLTKVREKFARVKLLIDLSLNKKPKFLGNKIAIQ